MNGSFTNKTVCHIMYDSILFSTKIIGQSDDEIFYKSNVSQQKQWKWYFQKCSPLLNVYNSRVKTIHTLLVNTLTISRLI